MIDDIKTVEIEDKQYSVFFEKTNGGKIAKVFYHEHWITAVGEDDEDAYSKLKQHIYAETEFSL